MLKVAVAATGPTMDALVPALFAESEYLLLVDAETGELLDVLEAPAADALGRGLYFSQKVVDFDCEAVLCGELEPEPFTILAEENCVTRYMAGGLQVLDSIHKMNAYALPLLTDFIGGTGCPDNDPDNCSHDHDDDCDGDCEHCEEWDGERHA